MVGSHQIMPFAIILFRFNYFQCDCDMCSYMLINYAPRFSPRHLRLKQVALTVLTCSAGMHACTCSVLYLSSMFHKCAR